MNHVNYFKYLFEPIPDYRKIVLIKFLIRNDNKFLQDCDFLNSDIESFKKEFKKILTEQNEEYLAYIKNEGEALVERFLNK